MGLQDILNIFLILALFIITTCIVFATYYFVTALKSIMQLSQNLDETVLSIKDKLRFKALAAIPALLIALANKVIKKKRG